MADQKRSTSFIGHLSQTLKTLIQELTQPHQSIQDEERRQNAQLLSGLLLVSILAVSLVIALVVYFDPNDLYDPRTSAAFIIVISAIILYGLNRLGYTEWATFGFATFLTLIFTVTPYAGNFPEFVAFGLVPMLLVGMFYSFRWTVAFIVGILLVVFILNNLYIDETIWQRRILWYFLLFGGALVLAFKSHLNQLESIRRRKLDQANTQLNATLNAIPDLLFELDHAGCLLAYHVPHEVDFGISFEDLVGTSIAEIMPEEATAIIMGAVEGAAKTGRDAGAVFSLDLEGVRQWFEVSIAAKEQGAINSKDLHFIVVARNITERRQAELLRAERTGLEIALEQEKRLADLRSQLISTITHEFRTPLTVILTSSTLLVDYNDRLSPEGRNEKIQFIIEQVKRLDTMLNNVSTLSKSQRGFLHYQPQLVDLAALCEQQVLELQSIAPPHIELVLDLQSEFELVEVDADLLRHALTNLISNAIKYSPDGGHVTLKAIQRNDEIVLCVSDKGMGIPAEDMTHLFQPFHRANNVGSIHGTGLGLSIVREAVDLHGGDITCESQLGVGTTFTISLPMRRGIDYVQSISD